MMSFDATSAGQGKEPASTAVMSPPVQAATPTGSLQSTTMTIPPNNLEPMARSARGHTHIWLVTGPAGCGKTSVAQHLAGALNMPYIEGDAFHSAANVEKMRSGMPLTDADRWDWLTALRDESIRQINQGQVGVVLTCSALKRKYRDVIRVAAYYDHHLLVHFIYLDASEELLLQRVTQRQGHYMGANMVHSQFEVLERPDASEPDSITIDVSRTLEEVQEDALARVIEMMESDLNGQ